MKDEVTVEIKINSKLARWLYHSTDQNLYKEQATRFSVIDGSPDKITENAPGKNATMFWLLGVAEVFTFRAFLHGQGFETAWLWDIHEANESMRELENPNEMCHVVLANVPFKKMVESSKLFKD